VPRLDGESDVGDAGRSRLAVIPGRPPRPGEITVGCPYHPRCDEVLDVCRTTAPPVMELPGGRTSRCQVATEVLEAGLAEAERG
jgi:oligopeptide/dipeptide ABC transporter ATP-binding protein